MCKIKLFLGEKDDSMKHVESKINKHIHLNIMWENVRMRSDKLFHRRISSFEKVIILNLWIWQTELRIYKVALEILFVNIIS